MKQLIAPAKAAGTAALPFQAHCETLHQHIRRCFMFAPTQPVIVALHIGPLR
ncbi:MAG: hypothetical protein ACRD18_15470 [Terriglobia bacterium]